MWYKINSDINKKFLAAARKKKDDGAVDAEDDAETQQDTDVRFGPPYVSLEQQEFETPASQLPTHYQKKPYLPRERFPGSKTQILQPPALDSEGIRFAQAIIMYMQNLAKNEDELTDQVVHKLLFDAETVLKRKSITSFQQAAISAAKKYVEKLIADYGTDFDAMLQNLPDSSQQQVSDNFVNLSEEEKEDYILSLVQVRVNAKKSRSGDSQTFRGKNLEEQAYEDMIYLPEFSEYTEKGRVLRQLHEMGRIGGHKEVIPSKITPQMRADFENLIYDNYIRNADISEKERSDLLNLWLGNTYLKADGTIAKTTGLQAQAAKSEDFGRIIQEKLLKPTKNKERILTFFAPNNNKVGVDFWKGSDLADFRRKLLDSISVNDNFDQFRTTAVDEKNEVGKLALVSVNHSATANYLQDPKRIDFFLNELVHIIKNEDPNDTNSQGEPYSIDYNMLHNAFKDWLTRFISTETYNRFRKSLRETQVTQQGEDAATLEDIATATNAVTNKGTINRIDSALLHSCDEIPEITRAQNEDYIEKAIECMQDEWAKIKLYGEKVVAKIKERVQIEVSRKSVKKSTFQNFLRKAFLWERMIRSTDRAVQFIVTGKERFRTTETSVLILPPNLRLEYINRNWRKVFEDNFFEADDFTLPANVEEENLGNVQEQLDEVTFFDDTEVDVSQRRQSQLETLEICKHFVQAGYAQNLQEAHEAIFGEQASKFVWPQIRTNPRGEKERVEISGKENYTITNAVKSRFKILARSDIGDLKDILLDQQILNSAEFEGKGAQTALSFLSVIGYDTMNAKFGLMRSQKSFASFKEKTTYLSQMLSKGTYKGLNVPFLQEIEPELQQIRQSFLNNSDDPHAEQTQAEADALVEKERASLVSGKIANLTPTGLNAIFDTINRVMPVVYGGEEASAEYLLDPSGFVNDKILTECIQKITNNNPNLSSEFAPLLRGNQYSIEELRSRKITKKINKEVVKNISLTFSEMMKQGYFIDEASEYSLFTKLLTNEIKNICKKLQNKENQENIDWYEKWSSHYKIDSINSFLRMIGIRNPQEIDSEMQKKSQFAVAAIAKKFSPSLYRLRSTHQLDEKIYRKLEKEIGDTTNLSLHDICRILVQGYSATAAGVDDETKQKGGKAKLKPKSAFDTRFIDFKTADVFASLLDMLPTQKIATVNLFNLRKYAMCLSR